MMRANAFVGIVFLSLVFAACGGGGGGSSSTGAAGVAPGSGVLPPGATSGGGGSSGSGSGTVSGSGSGSGAGSGSGSGSGGSGSTPTTAPSGYFVTGTLKNHSTNVAIAGATVVVAPPVYAGATPPPNPQAEATTAADGSFTLTNVMPGSNYIEIFDTGYATLHKPLAIASLANSLGTITLTQLSNDQTAWLTQANADRARYGAGALVIDELLLEGAQHWDDYMSANGYFNDACPTTSGTTCTTALAYEQSQGAQFTSSAQNIAAIASGSVWNAAESAWLGESSTCPQPASYATCQNVSGATHFVNLIDPNYVWVGLAEDKNGVSYNRTLGTSFDYYVEEFGTPFQSSTP